MVSSLIYVMHLATFFFITFSPFAFSVELSTRKEKKRPTTKKSLRHVAHGPSELISHVTSFRSVHHFLWEHEPPQAWSIMALGGSCFFFGRIRLQGGLASLAMEHKNGTAAKGRKRIPKRLVAAGEKSAPGFSQRLQYCYPFPLGLETPIWHLFNWGAANNLEAVNAAWYASPLRIRGAQRGAVLMRGRSLRFNVWVVVKQAQRSKIQSYQGQINGLVQVN